MDKLLQEDGFALLLEDGGFLLLNDGGSGNPLTAQVTRRVERRAVIEKRVELTAEITRRIERRAIVG